MACDLSQLVEPTDVPYQWIVDQLDGKDKRWDELRKQGAIAKVVVGLVSGAGYCSHVSRVNFHFESAKKPFSVFLKVPTTDKFVEVNNGEKNDFSEQMAGGLMIYHNQEINFYNYVAKNFADMQLPKLYGFAESRFDGEKRQHGRILLEDIGDRCMMANVGKGLSIKQCIEVVTGIAKLHAYTRHKLATSPEFFNAFSKTHQLDLNDRDTKVYQRIQMLGIQPLLDQKEAINNLLESRYMQTENSHERFSELEGSEMNRLDIKPVLTHGDLWNNNIMFAKTKDGNASDVLSTCIDYQTCYISAGMNDLARFIIISANADIQRLCTLRFLRVYYETMLSEVKKYGDTLDYDFDKLKEMYRFHYPHEYIFALHAVTIFCLKADAEERQRLGERLVCGFELIRKDFEGPKENYTQF